MSRAKKKGAPSAEEVDGTPVPWPQLEDGEASPEKKAIRLLGVFDRREVGDAPRDEFLVDSVGLSVGDDIVLGPTPGPRGIVQTMSPEDDETAWITVAVTHLLGGPVGDGGFVPREHSRRKDAHGKLKLKPDDD